ncbi:hypothetical protein [Mesorhizobium argentiipisi]|uniref:GNAT family N-acetyltransferase n=1 Tax=Mesorhizobium argentiipisi TaxID=3015175 RepID=UPI00301DC8C4
MTRSAEARTGDRHVVLRPVGEDNRAAILALELMPEQQGFVASNADSLEEAGEDNEALARAVVAAGRVVGFLMYSAPDDDDEAIIYRFMIDRREQGKGPWPCRGCPGAGGDRAARPHTPRLDLL